TRTDGASFSPRIGMSSPLDIEQLKGRIRHLASEHRAKAPVSPRDEPPVAARVDSVHPGPGAASRSGKSDAPDNLGLIERLADLGSLTPDMMRFPRALRPIARLAARAVLFLARFLTKQQTDCNHAMLTALNALRDDLDRSVREFDERLAQVHASL